MNIATLVIVLALAAAPSPPTATTTITEAKKLITSELIDPSSAQFRRLRTVKAVVQSKALTVACGEYNSKNKFGGYTGFATFAYEATALRGAVSRSSEGQIEFFGDSMGNLDSSAMQTGARVLAVCLGIPQ